MATRRRQQAQRSRLQRLRRQTRKGGAVTNENRNTLMTGITAFGNTFKGKMGNRPWNKANNAAKNKTKKNLKNTLTAFYGKYIANNGATNISNNNGRKHNLHEPLLSGENRNFNNDSNNGSKNRGYVPPE